MTSEKPIEIPIGRKPITLVKDTNVPQKPRDPRFDPKCSGSGDKRHFDRNYAFINEMRQKELAELKKAFKKESDREKRSEIQAAIGKISHALPGDHNQPKDRRRNKKLELVEQYKDLKKSGRITKYLERKRKKMIKKDSSKYGY